MAAVQFEYSPLNFARDLYDAGFRVGGGIVTALAVAGAESRYRPQIVNTTGNNPPSRDRGIVQINDFWHPEVTDTCAFNPTCAAKEMFRISRQGVDFTSWSVFQNGSYDGYMPWAWVIVDALGRIQARDARIVDATAKLVETQQHWSEAVTMLNEARAETAAVQVNLEAAISRARELATNLDAAERKIEAGRAALA